MSDTKQQQKIDKLMKVARGSRGDAESLRELAQALQENGAWNEATTVSGWAADAERKMAEEAAR